MDEFPKSQRVRRAHLEMPEPQPAGSEALSDGGWGLGQRGFEPDLLPPAIQRESIAPAGNLRL